MKKYGEIFVGEETATGFGWEARWYEDDVLADTANGDAVTYEDAVTDAQAWLATKGEE